MKLSQEKKDKISEQILAFLYRSFPSQPFTADIAKEMARDEEFIKRLMFELLEKDLVSVIRKNNKGEAFTRRLKWRLSNKVYDLYKARQQ